LRATLLLADSAQAVEGKLYILGGGWSVTGPQPVPMAIALKVDVPWDQSNTRHRWRLELIDADGQPVLLGEEGKQTPVEIEQEFEIGRPAGVKPGTALDFVVAINIQPLPLEPGRQYAWRLTIDGDSQDDWRLPFSTRSPVS
jgi:hypothetical protein